MAAGIGPEGRRTGVAYQIGDRVVAAEIGSRRRRRRRRTVVVAVHRHLRGRFQCSSSLQHHLVRQIVC